MLERDTFLKNSFGKIFFIALIFSLGAGFLLSQYIYYPYYGKNKLPVSAKWKVYETEHFKIYYYTKNRSILNNTIVFSEEAFSKVSQFFTVRFKRKIPIILYQSHRDFEMTNIYPTVVPEPVMGFSEPIKERIVIPGEFPSHTLKHLITHELTHIFQFKLLYGFSKRAVYRIKQPQLWIMEGMAEFVPDEWDPISLMVVRDAVFRDRIPLLTENEELSYTTSSSRAPYDFGHAVFDFIRYRFGNGGIRRFWIKLRNRGVFGKRKLIEETFNISIPQFNYEFKKYLRKRFKYWETKENSDDFSLPFSPRFPYSQVFSFSISPSQEVSAVLTANYSKYRIDVALISLRDGSVIKNITSGYNLKYENIFLKFDPSEGKALSWSPEGGILAFFGRKNYDYYVVFYRADGKFITEKKLKNLNEPQGIEFSHDGEKIVFTAIKNGKRDIFIMDLSDFSIHQITDDFEYEYSPSFSKDDKKIVFSSKRGLYHQLAIVDLSSHKKVYITNSPSNHINPTFVDDDKILFSYEYKDVFNIAEINLKTKEIRLVTDFKTGAFYPQKVGDNVYFTSYFNQTFSLYRVNYFKTSFTVKEKDNYIPPSIDFVFNEKNAKNYSSFSEFTITGLPSAGFAVATDGSTYEHLYLEMDDILGNKYISLIAYSLMGLKSYQARYVDLSHRLQYGIELFRTVYYYYYPYYYWYPELEYYYSYKDAIAVRKYTGIRFLSIYPINKFHRIEFSFSFYDSQEDLDYFYFPQGVYNPFFNGYSFPVYLSFVGETTRFSYFGPLSGYTYNFTLFKFIKPASDFRDAWGIIVDLRKYLPLWGNTLVALRFYGAKSGGEYPYLFYGGGNNEVRASNYLYLVGNNLFFMNAELRFTLVDLALTPIGLMGPFRGVLFVDTGGAWLKGEKFEFFEDDEMRLKNAIGSIGYGVELPFLGLPIHLEWVYRFDWKSTFDKEFKIWIGFDF